MGVGRQSKRRYGCSDERSLLGDDKATRVFRDELNECEQEEQPRRTLEQISQAVGAALAELNDDRTIQLVQSGHSSNR